MSEQLARDPAHEPHQQRLIKSCASCHDRKVKCDAPIKGLPCSRCAGRGERCLLKGRQRRRLRPKSSFIVESRHRHEPSSSSSTPDLPPHADTTTESPNKVVVAPEDGPWRAINYNNGIHYLSILTQAARQGADAAGDLSSASPADEPTDLRAGIDDLDPDDLEYLIKKGVFDLPPQLCLYVTSTFVPSSFVVADSSILVGRCYSKPTLNSSIPLRQSWTEPSF
jgi:hypothetical protein